MSHHMLSSSEGFLSHNIPMIWSYFIWFRRIILETDPNVIAGKVASHSMDVDAPLAEQVMLSFWFAFLMKMLIHISYIE